MSDEQNIRWSSPLSEQEVRKQTRLAEDFFTVYCNHIRITMSTVDFRLFVGETYPDAGGKLNIVENLSVAMTPEQAKATLDVLSGLVDNYEKSFGPIKRLPKAPPQPPKSEEPST